MSTKRGDINLEIERNLFNFFTTGKVAEKEIQNAI